MNPEDLTCADVESLVPAYVLSALESEESCAFAHHLVECRLHDEDLASERLMATRLASSVPPVAPPATLRNSLLDAFDKELAGPSVPIHPSRPAKQGWSLPTLLRAPTFAYAIAAAFLVLALGLGVWGASRGGSSSGVSGVRLATARSGNFKLDVTYLGSEHLAVLSMDLPPAPSGKTYQAWQIADGKPVSLGLITNNSGPMTVSADLKAATAIAISVEPTGGSQQPTTPPVLVSQF